MLCYAIFDLYPTRWSLLMEDFALVVFSAVAVLLLGVLAAWLMMILLLIILLPPYLIGVLHPAIQQIALRLQKGVSKEDKVPAPAAARFSGRARALLFAPSYRVKLWLRSARVRLASDVRLPKEFHKPGSGVKREMDVFSSPFVISEGKESPR